MNGNKTTTCANIDAALAAAESDDTRLGRLRDVLSDEAAAAGYREECGKAAAGRFTTPDLDNAVAAAEALRKRVSRVRELFATPGGDATLLTALEDRNPSWSHTGTPTDIERALDVAERRLDRRQAATLEHRVVLEAEQQFPNVPAAAWRRTGEGFHEFTDSGRPGRRLARTLADRAGAVAIAAERPEPPTPPGLVKRLFEWVRERVEKTAGQASAVEGGAPSEPFSGRRCRTCTRRRGRAGAGRAGPGRPVDRRGQQGRPAVGTHHGHTTPATDTLIVAAASISPHHTAITGREPERRHVQHAVVVGVLREPLRDPHGRREIRAQWPATTSEETENRDTA